MGNNNANLHTAKKVKNDEFYTLYKEVENEMKHYNLADKVIYCNCDNHKESNFVKYFLNNFESLGIKKLIATSYNENGHGTAFIYTDHPTTITLKGDGDFRSTECQQYLDEADVVITNPPFSLFREFVTLLMDKGKKFLILGNMNAITYKEIFKYIQDNQLWLGVSLNGTKCSFVVPESYEGNNVYIENGVRYAKVNNAIWFTNIDNGKTSQFLTLTKKYDPNIYHTYDNYCGIDVPKVAEIPQDYNGVMGVPITFLHKYNPLQFKIVKFRKGDDDKDLVYSVSDGKVQPYFRILVQLI